MTETTIDGRTYKCVVFDPQRVPHEPSDNELTVKIFASLLAALHTAKGLSAEIQFPDSETGEIWSLYVEAVA